MCFAGASQDAQIFELAHSLYAQGSFDHALTEYQKIGSKTGQVWYNMGVVAYAQQDYINALLYWLRAQKYGDAHTYVAAFERLQQLPPQVRSIEKSTSQTVVYYVQLLLKKIPMYVWQLLVLLFWYLLCWCWMKKYRCSGVKSGILAIILFLMCIPIMIGYYIDKNYVLVIADSADVYNGPNSALYKVGTVHQYTLATLLDTKKQWYKISHDGIIGWVERKSVAKI
jgi:hypothetical protein